MNSHFALVSLRGVFEAPSGKTVYIGQAQGSDVLVPNDSSYEDELIAKVVPNRQADGWHLVRLSRAIPLRVNGVEVNRVVYLQEGDTIETEGSSWKFRLMEGEKTGPTVFNVRKSAATLWVVLSLVIVLTVLVGWLMVDRQRETLTDTMRSDIEASLFTTRVDSLRLMYRDSVADSYVYASGAVGTAFLTTDSLIVTARHCIQPWLNQVLPHDYASLPSIAEWPVEKALFAETQNQLEGTDDWRIVSFLTLTLENGETFNLTSDDFRINTEFDDIVELGDYADPRYWRSISHRYTRRDMMLGDVAVARADEAGKIPLATEEELRVLLPKTGVKLAFFGHPEAGVTGNRLEYKTDELRLPLDDTPGLPGRLFLLSHEGSLSPGFSGGPVIVRDGLGFKAVGVVSVTDDRNGYRSYSVPASEAVRLRRPQ